MVLQVGVHLNPQQLVGLGGCRHLEVVNGAPARPQLSMSGPPRFKLHGRDKAGNLKESYQRDQLFRVIHHLSKYFTGVDRDMTKDDCNILMTLLPGTKRGGIALQFTTYADNLNAVQHINDRATQWQFRLRDHLMALCLRGSAEYHKDQGRPFAVRRPARHETVLKSKASFLDRLRARSRTAPSKQSAAQVHKGGWSVHSWELWAAGLPLHRDVTLDKDTANNLLRCPRRVTDEREACEDDLRAIPLEH